jgi:4-hydroxy-3-polyprenylbenzoate decarboxylase
VRPALFGCERQQVVWSDFREFLAEVDRRGDLRVVEGAACDLEIGTLTELMCERQGPLLLFDRIRGFPAGYRIATQPYWTPRRCAIALGLPEEGSAFDMFRVWREKLRHYRPIEPVQVAWGPVLEQVLEDGDVDLTRFPVPRWHVEDGGPYLGTGCTVITRDPDEKWVNVGTYRCMLHDGQTTGIDIAPYHHGNLQMRKWWARGEACPVAVAITPDPYLFWVSTNGLPWGTPEYAYAGFIKGEPLAVVRGPRSGLPLPANAEMLLEGIVPPPEVESRPEGPFGEFTGYYGGGTKPRPVIRVQAVYHRTAPILHGEPALKPPVGDWGCSSASLLRVWDGLERSGIPGIQGVFAPLTEGGLTLVVAIKQQYAGHARQVGRIASGLTHTFFRLIVVVDDDIDPSDTEAVLWAIATRSDPAASWEFEPGCPSSTLDPIVPPARKARGGFTSSRALVIACRPWEWLDQFPPVNRASDALRERTRDRWPALFA